MLTHTLLTHLETWGRQEHGLGWTRVCCLSCGSECDLSLTSQRGRLRALFLASDKAHEWLQQLEVYRLTLQKSSEIDFQGGGPKG